MMGDAKGEEARPAPGVLPVPPLLPQARRDRLGSRVPSSPGCREPKGSRESTEEPHGKRVRGRGAAAACPHLAREGGGASKGSPGGGGKGGVMGCPGMLPLLWAEPLQGHRAELPEPALGIWGLVGRGENGKKTSRGSSRRVPGRISLMIAWQSGGERNSEGVNIDGVYSAVRPGKGRGKYLMLFPFQKNWKLLLVSPWQKDLCCFSRGACLKDGYLQAEEDGGSGVFEKRLIRVSGDISLMVLWEEIIPVNKMLGVTCLEVLIIV